MTSAEKIAGADLDLLRVIKYPDPRLKQTCTPIEEIDDSLRALAGRMAEVMFESRGVGLAAPQVGLSVRLFIASPTYSPDDLHVYVNPRITGGDGVQNEEEGCLSFPGIYNRVKRKQIVTVEATDLEGNTFIETCRELASRIVQHEMDHLDGITLIDRMGTVARLTNRNLFRDLEEQFRS